VLRFRLMVKRGPCYGLKHQKEKRSMDHFAGLDVSVKDTSVCIVDDTGRIVREVKVASEARRHDAAKSPLDEMNQALGEFLTEMGRLEFTMLMVVDLVSDPGIDYLFDEYAGKTFGGKIKWFNEWCVHTAMQTFPTPIKGVCRRSTKI
jgi:hypothetical protein